jgi:hypothetical protein
MSRPNSAVEYKSGQLPIIPAPEEGARPRTVRSSFILLIPIAMLVIKSPHSLRLLGANTGNGLRRIRTLRPSVAP